MKNYLKTLEQVYLENSNSQIAEGQAAYMKNQFEFYGIKTPIRRQITKPFLVKEYLPPKNKLNDIVKTLWQKPQREYQYFAQELLLSYSKSFGKEDMPLFEYMILHKSWWDTVDVIAPKMVGSYFLKFPEGKFEIISRWLNSGNIWLQRSAVIFQLKYKDEVDTEFLSLIIKSLLGSKEFFINKGIGWMLREYSRTNPVWVKNFAESHPLASLSKREATKLL